MKYTHRHMLWLLWMVAVSSCGLLDSRSNAEPPGEAILVKTTSEVEANNRSQRICGKVDGATIVVQIVFKPYHGNERHWLGTDGGIPELVIDSFEVRLNGKAVSIPRSLYGDFSDVFVSQGTLRLYQDRRGYRVCYLGGDGAAAYTAHFYFDALGLYRMDAVTKGMGEDYTLQMIGHNRYVRKR